jgi:hypothetical protein
LSDGVERVFDEAETSIGPGAGGQAVEEVDDRIAQAARVVAGGEVDLEVERAAERLGAVTGVLPPLHARLRHGRQRGRGDCACQDE